MIREQLQVETRWPPVSRFLINHVGLTVHLPFAFLTVHGMHPKEHLKFKKHGSKQPDAIFHPLVSQNCLGLMMSSASGVWTNQHSHALLVQLYVTATLWETVCQYLSKFLMYMPLI